MSTPPNASMVARRDALLKQLEAYHEELLKAAQAGDGEAMASLVENRQDTIERLRRVAKEAPIPPEVGARLVELDQELQAALKLELAGVRTHMGQQARLGKAALRYRNSN